MQKRETVGKLSSNLLANAISEDHSSEEQMREQLEEWDKNVYACIAEGKRSFNTDFYLVVETKKERIMKNVLRNYFFCRLTCPTPNYDQSVFKYHRNEERIEFLWVLPSKDTCKMIKNNVLELTPDHKELIGYVLDDADGTLLRRCKQLNGEL